MEPRLLADLRATLHPLAENGLPASVQEEVPLAPLTSLGVGGSARVLVRARTVAQARGAIAWARGAGLPWQVLGGGSNVVVADAGFPGLVLQVGLTGMSEEAGLVRVAAGEDWDGFVAACIQRGWAGLECLAGIPGWVGATPVQNVGAYGQEVADSIVSVTAYDAQEDRVVEVPASECGFAYRQSRFKAESPCRHVILAVTFTLVPGGPPTIRYHELEKSLPSPTPTLAEARETVLALRRRKSMVVDAADPDSRSAGSFFTNPVVDAATFDAVVARAQAQGHEAPPHFATAEGRIKLPAAWLIERAGFPRGMVEGPVGLSRHHALAIVNRGGATAADVLALAARICATVHSVFGVTLFREPVLVGPSQGQSNVEENSHGFDVRQEV